MEVDDSIFSDSEHDRPLPDAAAAAQPIGAGDIVGSSVALPHAPKEVPITPAPVSLHLHDDSVNCVCPPGTSRLPRDMVMTVNSDTVISWTHLPCKPLSAESTTAQGTAPSTAGESSLVVNVKDSTHGGDGSSSDGKDPMEMFAGFLGPNPTPHQRQKVKNFTSTFRCDGPCAGKERTLSDFFLCKKCMAWQHKECQLYGEVRDRGRPVCNRCYVDFVIHFEEIEQWQRRQLLRAVQEAVKYVKDPDTMHQTWRRKWCRDLIKGFLAKNKGHFVSYLVKRLRQQTQQPSQQQSAQQQPVQLVQQQPQSAPANNTPARKRPKRKSTTLLSGVYNDADANSEEDTKGEILLASDDDIIAIPRVKSEPKRKSARTKTSATKSPATAPAAQRTGKRRRSPSPPSRTAGLRGPRKSVRMSDRQRMMDTFRDDSDEGEDEAELLTVKTETRETPPSTRRAPLSAPTIACSCFSSRLATTLDSFECDSCGMWQHKRCGKAYDTGLYSICNLCLNRSSPPPRKQAPKPARKAQDRSELPQDRPKPKPEPARTLPPAPAAPPVKLAPALANEVRTLSSTILWTEYISIPSPDDNENETRTQSSTPPQEWLTEMESRLAVLLTAAGAQQMGIYLNPVLQVFPREPDAVLQALRDLAVWIVSKGTLRGKRSQLGVLLEVLGLDDKGVHWKGAGL